MKALPLPFARFMVGTGLYRIFIARGYRKASKTTVQEMLEKITENQDLRAVLAANYGDYGVEPSRASSFMQSTITKHYMNGAYYPNGGPSNIPKKIIQNIVDLGGKVLVSAPVKHILVDSKTKAAIGVEMEDGTKIKAKNVISDIGLINTATELLPADLIKVDVADDDHHLHPAMTGMSLFVGLKGGPEELNLPKCCTWIHPSNDLSGSVEKLRGMSLDEGLRSDSTTPPIFVSVPCTKDRAWVETYPNKSTLEIISLTPWHWFEKFDALEEHGEDYKVAKKMLADEMWSRVSHWLSSSVSSCLLLVDSQIASLSLTIRSRRLPNTADGGSFRVRGRQAPEDSR